MSKVLFIITSHGELPGSDSTTGVWLGEFTEPYYLFKDAGFEVDLASPNGGQPPVDDTSKLTEHITGSNRKFNDDPELQHKFANTLKLENLNTSDYDAVFFPGGHGPIWDLASDTKVADLILKFDSEKKTIGAVCHGSAAFISAAKKNPEFIRGKRISCFSNMEEKLSGKEKYMPYLLEDALQGLGAEIDNTKIPYTSNTTTDDNLITGQNPMSSGGVAKLMIEVINSKI